MRLRRATRSRASRPLHVRDELGFQRSCGVAMFALGAGSLLSTLILPDPDKSDHPALAICALLLALGAVAARLVPPSERVTRIAALYGVLMVSAVMAVARPVEATPLFYLWPILVAAYFMSRREVALVLGVAWGSLALVLALWTKDSMKSVLFMGTSVSVTLVAVTVTLLRERLTAAIGQLSVASSTDHLTALLNRRGFDAELASQVERARRNELPLALALFDLDHFKQVNDQYGHAAGDQALARFATLLEDECRGGDTPARLGGEEFAVVLLGADLDGALEFATRTAERLRRETSWLAGEMPLSVSAGVAQLSGSDTPSTLLVAADRALYGAKSAGRHRVGVWDGEVHIGATIDADPPPPELGLAGA